MQHSLKLVTWILLAMIVALPVIAQASPFERPLQPAGCDEHSGSQPSHPAGYTCCQGAHDTAAVQRAFNLPTVSGHVSSILDSVFPAIFPLAVDISHLPLAADSPPLSTSLRI